MNKQEREDESVALGLLKAPRLAACVTPIPPGIIELAKLACVDIANLSGQWMLFHPNGIANVVYQRFQLQTYEQWQAAIVAATEL